MSKLQTPSKSRLDAVFGTGLTSGSMHSKRILEFWLALFGWTFLISAQERHSLPATQPLTLEGDLSALMVSGIDTFLMRLTEGSMEERQKLWHREFSSPEAYLKSVESNREHFRKCIGAVDARLPVKALEYVSSTASPAKVAETPSYTIFAVRWPVFENVFGEGLLLEPKGEPVANIIAIPDADQTPEMLVGLAPGIAAEAQFGRRMAENGCRVIVPVLIDRQDTWSGNPALKRFTNQPHREWIYRQSFEMGRHIIGYEVQKILAAVDWLASESAAAIRNPQSAIRNRSIGVAGYGEGALLAFYTAALDPRIGAAMVSGYFDSRQRVWEEPIYRNIFGLLHEFGDAEIASLIAPRPLIVEHSESPKIDGPPKAREGRNGAASGKLATPDFTAVEMEVARANGLARSARPFAKLVHGNEGMVIGPGSEPALSAFLKELNAGKLQPMGQPALDLRKEFNPADRQKRQIEQLVQHTQRLLQVSERTRDDFFWKKLKTGSVEEYQTAAKPFQDTLWE